MEGFKRDFSIAIILELILSMSNFLSLASLTNISLRKFSMNQSVTMLKSVAAPLLEYDEDELLARQGLVDTQAY